MTKIKINETHICILKKYGNLLKVETIKMNFEFKNSLTEFQRMCNNENKERYELDNFLLHSPLKNILPYFDYCENLSSAFEVFNVYETIDFEEYKKRENDLINSLEEHNKTQPNILKDIPEELKKFKKYMKRNIFHNIHKRVVPYMLKENYAKFSKNNEILAYSHRKKGWTFPDFKLGKDFDVIFKTNFGYGSSSYFFTIIRYKGIEILPYSDWISYANVNKTDIIRYTRKYYLKNSAWLETMDFTAKLYNYSITDPGTFINEYIINECQEMVEGLVDLLNRNEDLEVIHSYFIPNKKIELKGIEVLIYKGEKISGALTFIQKISELMRFSSKIDFLIKQIYSCNLSIYPELNLEVASLKSYLKHLQDELNSILPEWECLKSEKEHYDVQLEKIHSKVNAVYSELNFKELQKKADLLFSQEYPESTMIYKEFNDINTQFNELNKKIRDTESKIIKLEEYARNIEKYFDEIGEPIEKYA
jgi:hypothetical protein